MFGVPYFGETLFGSVAAAPASQVILIPPVAGAAATVNSPTLIVGIVRPAPTTAGVAGTVTVPVAAPQNVTLPPGVISGSVTVNTPTLVLGIVRPAPPTAGVVETVSTPTANLGVITISVTALSITFTANTPTIVQTATNLVPASAGLLASVTTPITVRGNINLVPGNVNSTAIANDPFLVNTINPQAGAANCSTIVLSPTCICGSVTQSAIAAASTASANTPAVVPGARLAPTGGADITAVASAPIANPQNVQVLPAIVPGTVTANNPSPVPGARIVTVASLVIASGVVEGLLLTFRINIHMAPLDLSFFGQFAGTETGNVDVLIPTEQIDFTVVDPTHIGGLVPEIFCSIETTSFSRIIGSAILFVRPVTLPPGRRKKPRASRFGPNITNRLFAKPSGAIEFSIIEDMPEVMPAPSLEVYISKEIGQDITPLFSDLENRFILELNNYDRTKDIVFKTTPDDLLLAIGTYTVRVVQNRVEIFKKSLTVKNHPVLK